MPRPVHAFAFVWLLAAGDARADRHVVGRGETLEHVARVHGCTVEAVLRANHLKTTLVPPGTVVIVPSCSIRSRARTRTLRRERVASDGDARVTSASDDDAKARAALAVIDGASWVGAAPGGEAAQDDAIPELGDGGPSESLGAPWRGRLIHGAHLGGGAGYVVRRPSRAWGAAHVVEHVRHAIAEVRALYPDVHTLAIGDLSAEHGGKISQHHSHQSGLDVDVGFFYTRVPDGYPASFAPASSDLDLEATWALLVAFSRTAGKPGGVQMIFLDRGVQRRLYDWAHKRGTPDDELAFLLQYPRGNDVMAGLVRHWPNHTNHFHVRFEPL